MSEQLSPWGTPPVVEKPTLVANETSPFHQETAAEVLPEQKRRSIGQYFLEKFANKPKSVVGDLSESLHVTGKLVNYRSTGLDNLSDGGFETTGRYDHSREGVLGAIREEADVEAAQRSVDPFSPDASVERATLQAKQSEAEAATLAAAQNAEMRRKS